ncbi:MAG: hypothetical protein ACRDF0_03575, partial [Candidatus Limnocylindria bacterium]
GLIAAAGVLLVVAYGFKAYGWRRLFRATERPGPLALAAQTLLILSGASIFFAAVAWRTSLHAWSFRPGRAGRLAQT